MASAETGGYSRPELLADVSWLRERLDDPKVKTIDCRDDPGKYDLNHIPGAVYMNYKQTKASDDGIHVLTPQEAARRFGELGISDDDEVVVYDDVGSYAARVWWTLSHYGHRNVRLLNGGWKKWVAEDLPVTREIPRPAFATFSPHPREDDIATADEVMHKLEDPEVIVFDTGSGVECYGLLESLGHKKNAERGGHVPSARWVNWKWSLESGDHTMKPADQLHGMFRRAGLDPGKEVIVYCQSAARSAHQLFTLELLGYDNVKNYDGSWKEWGNSSRPIQLAPNRPSTALEASRKPLLVAGALVAGVYLAARLGRRLARR